MHYISVQPKHLTEQVPLKTNPIVEHLNVLQCNIPFKTWLVSKVSKFLDLWILCVDLNKSTFLRESLGWMGNSKSERPIGCTWCDRIQHPPKSLSALTSLCPPPCHPAKAYVSPDACSDFCPPCPAECSISAIDCWFSLDDPICSSRRPKPSHPTTLSHLRFSGQHQHKTSARACRHLKAHDRLVSPWNFGRKCHGGWRGCVAHHETIDPIPSHRSSRTACLFS